MDNFTNDDIKKIAAFMLMTLAISNTTITGAVSASPMDINSSMSGFNQLGPGPIDSVAFYAPLPGITPSVSVETPNVAFYAPLPGVTPSVSVETPNVAFYAPLPNVDPPASIQVPSVEIYAPLSSMDTINTNVNKGNSFNGGNSVKIERDRLLPVNYKEKIKSSDNYGNVQIIDDGRQYIFK